MNLIESAAAQKGKHARIGVNWQQAVLCVTFAEQITEDEFVMEDANEGERQ